MKTLFFSFILGISAFSLASESNFGIPKTQSSDSQRIILAENNGIVVYGETYSFNGITYISLHFENTTNQNARILWSAAQEDHQLVINMDGTIESFLTLPAGGTSVFGLPFSDDPLIQMKSNELETELKITIQLQ